VSSILFMIIGIGFLLSGWFGDDRAYPRRSRYRSGAREPLPISSKLVKNLCLVIGASFMIGGFISIVGEYFVRK
jgi:hypothetical protein